MNRPPTRLKTIARWTGLLLLALVFLAWPFNGLVCPDGVTLALGESGGLASRPPSPAWAITLESRAVIMEPPAGYVVLCFHGRILVAHNTRVPHTPTPRLPVSGGDFGSDDSRWTSWGPVEFGTHTGGFYERPEWIQHTGVLLPLWPFSVTAALLCAYFLYRLLRPRPGLCPTCAYDLRAHLEGAAGDKCPECGTPILLTHEPPP